MGYINVKGKNLHFRFISEEYNTPENPLIVFLHEGLGSIPQWKDFPEKVCKNLKLPGLLYERYGYGKSDILTTKREKDYLVNEGIEALPELINNLNVKKKLILIGHSDGASVALAYAAKNSDKILCLIAEAPHVFIEEVSVNGINLAIKAFEKNNKFRNSLEKYHDIRTESMFYGWAHTWTSNENFDWNMEYLLQHIKCPVYVIQGENDEYGSYKQVYAIINQVSGAAKHFLIPDCGHTPHFQKTDLVMREIESFINTYK